MDLYRKWIKSENVLPDHKEIEIRQVYCWILTKDTKIVIVSKDGEKWQFPGGHPITGESMMETCFREVMEETGVDLRSMSVTPKMFGYYHVIENGEEYLQVRFTVKLKSNSGELKLETQEHEEEEIVHFVEAVTLEEATKRISWLKATEEYSDFKEVNSLR
jgi:8-oxo-dGTP pyrophosphatase MutT (NUDIX family)